MAFTLSTVPPLLSPSPWDPHELFSPLLSVFSR